MTMLAGLASTGCHAQRKTAQVAPSGVIAACSARELATALWLDEGDKIKIKHGITIGSEIGGEGSATLGIEDPKTGAKGEVAGSVSGKLTEEKASEVELNLPEDRLCVELGYKPQLGRWEGLDAGLGLNGKPCVVSDTNNCICRRVAQRNPNCGSGRHGDQVTALEKRLAFAGHDGGRHDEAAKKSEAKDAALKACLDKCTCDAADDLASAVGAPAGGDASLKQAAVKQRGECCLAKCRPPKVPDGVDSQ